MKEIVAWTVEIWNMYWGTGWMQYLLAAGCVCVLFLERKKGSALFWYTIFLLGLFFCPISGRVIMRCVGKEVYWRVLWLLPVVVIIAGGFTGIVKRVRNYGMQSVLIMVLVGSIFISGTGMIKAGNFERVYNNQQVPDEVVAICEKINSNRKGRDISIATDDYISSYVRVYDPSLNMVYGRRGAGAVNKIAKSLYEQINTPSSDGGRISKLASDISCTYVVMVPPDEEFILEMQKGGYQILDLVDSYYIFVCDK